MTDRPSPPLARDDPPWSDCGDPTDPAFGTLFARPAAAGAVFLSFDLAGRRHALTLLGGRDPPSEVALHGRRFVVVAAGDPERL